MNHDTFFIYFFTNMELTTILPLAGGLTGGVGTGLAYCKSSNRIIDNIVVPVGGFIVGGQVGGIAADLLGDAPTNEKLFSAGAKLVVLGAGYLCGRAWQSNSKHTDAGSVGIGYLGMLVADVGIRVVDSLTTKLLPPMKY